MEFGRLLTEELDAVDFTLPPEPARNSAVLTATRIDSPKVYVGMARWGRHEWVGNLYPKGTKDKDFLQHYVVHFNSVELNATHYKVYNRGGCEKWASVAGPLKFKFCPKMYKGVTHFKSLQEKSGLLAAFLEGVEGFGEHLGPIFIQLPDQFSEKRFKDLFAFLQLLPSDKFQFFLEVRHPDVLTNEQLFDYLQTRNIGVVITDAAGRRDCAHMKLTVRKAFIRCNLNEHPTDPKRIIDWANRISSWLDKGIEEVYFFVHARNELAGLYLAKEVIETFNNICKTKIPELKFFK